MYQRLLFSILFLVSGCINQEGGTQSHVPVCIFEPATERLDYPFRVWSGNGLFHLESATERFEYDMLGHPVIETKLDSVYPCRLIFDTGCAGMLILDKNFAKKNGLINRFCPTESLKSGWNFERDIPYMTLKGTVSLSIGEADPKGLVSFLYRVS